MQMFLYLPAIYLFLILLVVLLVYLTKVIDRLNALLQSVEHIRQNRMPEEKAEKPVAESEPVLQPPLPVPVEAEAEIPPPLPVFEDSVPLKEEPLPETPPPLPEQEEPPPLPVEVPVPAAGQVQGRMRSLKNWLLYGQLEAPESSERSAEKLLAATWLLRAGILVILFTAAFMLKLSIERGLLAQEGRVILSYVSGAVLLFFGIRLQQGTYRRLGQAILGIALVLF